MKREDVIRLAEQAGFEIEQPSDGHNVSGDNACLERFAALVAAAEGERVTLAALQAAEQTTAVVVEGIQAAVLAELEACANVLQAGIDEWVPAPDAVSALRWALEDIRARGQE